MFTYRASYLLCFLGLVTPSVLAANQSHALGLNGTGANPYNYVIPNVFPEVTIYFSNRSPDRVTAVSPPSVYMCAIENLALICRRNRNQEMTTPGIFTYGTVTIRLDRVRRRSEPVFTHNIACAVLRGLPEYMTLSDWWVESFVHVVSEDYVIGTAKVWNSQREGSVAPVGLVGLQNSTGSDATA